jgi:alpha-amylase/alpha-mannosidase (GH57 family)
VTLVVHAHFYQPPREDPRTGVVPVEPTAVPWHDWNARIAAECYHPNTAARIVDEKGAVTDLIDNYRHLSFNVGPTLLAWLRDAAPTTYERIVKAGQAARGALAQGFHHAILPLCHPRDQRTQVRWGLADFRRRFGYEAEGMWLPETAVSDEVLGVLVDEGVRFVILAPAQIDGEPGPGLYRWAIDERMTLVVYDGALSHDVAFGAGAMTSETLIDRVLHAGSSLVVVATDGETFGHHHKFADRTLAYALAREGPRRGVAVRNTADIVRDERERGADLRAVHVRESAWSCAHGLDRWRADCGCSTGGGAGWHQRWRAPLRAALDLLRDVAAEAFERRGVQVFATDPWAARDAYVDVAIGARSWENFAVEYAPGEGGAVALALLEGQRHAMAMYTSCGWFFNDIAGIEARIVLRHALALMGRHEAIGEPPPLAAFVALLAQAEGNQGLNGDQVWSDVAGEGVEEQGVAEQGVAEQGVAEQGVGGPVKFAPIVSDLDAAQDAVYNALHHGGSLRAQDLLAIAGALGVKTPET